MTRRSDSGIALMTTMMVMLLLSSLLVGFTTLVMQDGRSGRHGPSAGARPSTSRTQAWNS